MQKPVKNDPPFGKIIQWALITLVIGLTLVFIASSLFPDVDHPPAETFQPNETFNGTNPPDASGESETPAPLYPENTPD